MTRVILLSFLGALAACSPEHGERCNPNLFESECGMGLRCVHPTAPMCGVAYCCSTDDDGNVTDPHPSCQPDPMLPCAPDLATEAPDDGGTTD